MYYQSYFISNRRPPRKNWITVALFPALLFTNGVLKGLPLLELLATQCTNRRYKCCALVRCITKVISFLTDGHHVKAGLLSPYFLHYSSPMVLWEVYHCLKYLLHNVWIADISIKH